MISWKAVLSESPIEWLLEEGNSSVRYFTLRDVLDRSECDCEVIAAKKAIAVSPVVRRMLQKQKQEGYWEEPESPYLPKYKSSYWQIMTLSQLGMSKADARVRKACEYIFRFQLAEGGFSSYTYQRGLQEYTALRQKGKRLPPQEAFVSSFVHEHQYSCLTGNMAAALIQMGYEEDLRVKKALEWLVKVQNKDGGWLCPYWRAHVRDKHGCFYGTICPLEAFSLVKKESLTEEMRHTIEGGSEFLLMHRLFKADHHGYKVINRTWLKLSFPVFYGYDILRGLDVVTRLGYVKDERLNDAVEALLQKRQKDGKWILESSPVGRMQANIEVKGKPSKWITLIALRTLKRLG
jgi:hypothetical protein